MSVVYDPINFAKSSSTSNKSLNENTSNYNYFISNYINENDKIDDIDGNDYIDNGYDNYDKILMIIIMVMKLLILTKTSIRIMLIIIIIIIKVMMMVG